MLTKVEYTISTYIGIFLSYESNIERFLFVLFHAYFAFGPTVPYNDGTKKFFYIPKEQKEILAKNYAIC